MWILHSLYSKCLELSMCIIINHKIPFFSPNLHNFLIWVMIEKWVCLIPNYKKLEIMSENSVSGKTMHYLIWVVKCGAENTQRRPMLQELDKVWFVPISPSLQELDKDWFVPIFWMFQTRLLYPGGYRSSINVIFIQPS